MTIIASISLSLDGFYTAANPSEQHPLGIGGETLHGWFAHDVADRGQLTADEVLAPEFERTGALVMGWDSYEHAQALWGPHPPFEMPIFVLSRTARDDDVREGSTFHFLDSFDTAIERAKAVAGAQAVGLHGGGAIRQGLCTGVLEELQLHLVPTILGQGRALFAGVMDAPVTLELIRAAEGPGVTHLKYRVQRK